MDMAEVKAFNSELSALYDNRPPISKAKMGAITRGAIKAIKFYKHVVHSVEKFILKCKAEYKIPGLYVIDSIVRQSRHQFGADKDVFAPRFAKNMQQTFGNLLRCLPEDKRNIIRVLNLWQKNNVFGPDVIQPLFDMIDPNHPIHQEIASQLPHSNGSMGSGNVESKNSPNNAQHTPNMTQNNDQNRQNSRNHDSAANASSATSSSVNFNRRLLNVDFEYESEDDGIAGDSSPVMPRNTTTSAPVQPPQLPNQNNQINNSFLLNPLLNPQDALGSILINPDLMRQIQSIQAQMMMANFPMQPGSMPLSQEVNYVDTSQPPPLIHKMDDTTVTGTSPLLDEVNNESDIEFVDDAGPQVIEIDGNDSRSPSPKSSRRRRSRSRERSRRSRSRSRRNSRSRSRERRRRSRDRSRDRNAREKPRDREKEKEREKEREKEKEKERERRKKGLPPIKKDTLSVCSTTLWVGHLSKLVQEEELSDDFGAIGDVVSIDLVSPRGCAFIVMNRRRDAARAIAKLNKHKMHGKAITVAWAPSKGVKGREWKDFWEVEAGACYIPWSRLPSGPNDGNGLAVLEVLEEGGVLDDETLPNWLQRKGVELKPKTMAELITSGLQPNQTGMMVMSPLQPPPSLGVDTSCLPPPLGSLGFPTHPALPMALPLLGFKPSPQPGLQALHLQAVLAHQQQQQQLATQLLLAPPPRLPPHPSINAFKNTLQSAHPLMDNQDDAMELDTGDDAIVHPDLLQNMDPMKQNSLEDSHMSEKLKALVANPPPSFSIPPPNIPNLLGKPPLLSSQPFSVNQPPPNLNMHPDQNVPVPLLQNNINLPNDRDKDGKRDRDNIRKDRRDRDRDRTRDRHDRDRDRDRDRERGERDRGERERGDKERDDKDRNRGDKERERDRSGRDRNNRWGGREPRVNREQSPNGLGRHGGLGNNAANERSLQDRLWEMANGPGPRPQQHPDSPQRLMRNNDRSKDAHINDSLLGDGPTDIERRKNRTRDPSPGGMMGPNGPLGLAIGPGGPLGPVGPNGPMGPLNNMGIMGPNIPMMSRSALPPMAPFRIGRDEIRMRNMGPRGPLMRPGVWIDGPAQYGPRFNGGPAYNRPPFDRSYDGSPYDRSFDNRPHFDGPGRAPFDVPPYDSSRFDGPEGYYDRGGQRGPRGPRSIEGRRSRGDRDKEGRGDRPPRSSRWAENDTEKYPNKTESTTDKKNSESEDGPKDETTNAESSVEKPADFEKSPINNKTPERDSSENVCNDKVDADIPVATPTIVECKDDRVAESAASQDVANESKELVDNAADESCNSRMDDANDEGRGTPCRDEPIGASNSTPDLTDP